LKILFLTQTYPRFDGDTAGPFIRDLALGLLRLGDEVTVLIPHAPEVRKAWDDAGIRVRSFRYAPESWELLGYSRSLDADEKVKKGAGLVAPFYLLAARRAARRLLAAEPFDLVHAHWIVPNGLAAAPLARRVPLAIGLHGSDVFMAEKPVLRAFAARALRSASLLTGCSQELVDRVCRLGAEPATKRVIPYGVDTAVFEPGARSDPGWRSRLGVPDGAELALSVGRMVTKKGYQVLLPALGRLLEAHPNTHFVFAGEGDRLEEFRQATARFGDRVHFPGIVFRQDLPDLYRSADLFFLPAIHDAAGNVDGLPNVILEAMATGLPVVASGISGIPLAVEHEVTGLLVEEGDGAGFAAAVGKLLANPELRRSLGAAGRRKAEAELTWDAVAARYHEAYETMLGR